MKTLGALLIGLILSLFAAPAAMALDTSKPAAVADDGDGKGKKHKKGKHAKKHAKKDAKKHGKKHHRKGDKK
jgi:Ni/Co efflux regulator RcnB